MAVHAFGILPRSPVPGERYDTYEPERYGCVAVDDQWVEPLAESCGRCLSTGTLWTCRGRGWMTAASP